jgi:hypothetical protein
MTALKSGQHLSNEQRRQITDNIRRLEKIKTQIEEKAKEMGYSDTCKASIPICQGECCKWHFPKNLSEVDFFLAIHKMPAKGIFSLLNLLSQKTKKSYQCPLLTENGCMFTFDERPLVCTIAYPCFAGQSYWNYLDAEKRKIKDIYNDIENIIKLAVGS